MTPAAAISSSGSEASLFDVFVNCPLCGSPDCHLLFAHKECGNVVRSAQCRLRYTRSRWAMPWPDIRLSAEF
jgi:hypothetical protein